MLDLCSAGVSGQRRARVEISARLEIGFVEWAWSGVWRGARLMDRDRETVA